MCAPQALFAAPVNVAFFAAQLSGDACQVGDDVVSESGVTVNKAGKIERYYTVVYAPHKPVVNRFEQR
ncbi:hypothetical protein [Pectobacterium parmentieri]|uniref:hypothetical protein n=1 Tax=Pectobacterium parmentieri TaxID=1905730 RepID=UPI0003029B56|nr:hypothetical protein [Pectobacterium parmentieri]RKO81290.1 hypothetical protein C5E04_00045 [Pectobacterium parmentieri]